jgi:hypothetical protein
MKFPSLLRTPKHQRFHIEPRYYDPVKEDIKNRKERIRMELKSEKNGATMASGIRGSFQRQQRSAANATASVRQLIIVVTFLVLAFGYLEYGTLIFNIFWLAIPIYLFYRLRGIKRKNNHG